MGRAQNTFWDDPARGVVRSYGGLIRDLNLISDRMTDDSARELDGRGSNRGTHSSNVTRSSNPYDHFLGLVHALAHGYRFEVAASPDPIEATNSEFTEVGAGITGSIPMESIRDWDHLVELIESHRDEPLIGLRTSGTTGRPKIAAHSFASITRGVKSGDRHENDVWALAYHPSHIAALHVFFQAFLNRNTIGYVFSLPAARVLKVLRESGVTHISATPTYYRQLLLCDLSPFGDVRVVSSGGEPLSTELLGNLEALFPNAKIRNIYALTEAGSLFASDGDTFAIPPQMKDRVRISEDGELLLHKQLLAYLEDSPDGEWYHTGDIVERTDATHFKIVHRDTDLINVGGFSVDPHEVEHVIVNMAGVVDVVVRGRANRITGNVLEAVVVKDSEQPEDEFEERIIRFAESHLPPHKVPRIIRFESALELTRTGKKART